MSDTLFLLGLILPFATVVVGFLSLLSPARQRVPRRSLHTPRGRLVAPTLTH